MSFSNLFTKLFIFYFFINGCCSSNLVDLERQLHTTLFQNYNPNVIPRTNTTDAIGVSIKLKMLVLDNLDVKTQTFSARTFIDMEWQDITLAWNPSNYSGLQHIYVLPTRLWVPDLHIEGSFETSMDVSEDGSIAVDYTGKAKLSIFKSMVIACPVDIRMYPFDKQSCVIDFKSFMHLADEMYMVATQTSIDMGQYSANGEWEFTTKPAYFYDELHANSFFHHLKFPFTVRRKPLFYVMNVVSPLLFTSFLNIFCFILPAESGERMTLSISTFLTLAVFLTIVNDSLPVTSDSVSVLGLYMGLQLMWSCFTVVVSVLSIYFSQKMKENRGIGIKFPLARFLFGRNNRVSSVVGDNDSQTDAGDNVSTIFVPNEDKRPIVNENNAVIMWRSLSLGFERLCLITSIVWQISVHLWFVIGIAVEY